MRILPAALLSCCLFATAGGQTGAPSDSGSEAALGEAAPAEEAPAGGKKETETCSDLIRRVKRSDCAKPVARFLEGASLLAGLALYTSSLDVSAKDTTLATMVGILSPAPFLAFALPVAYFGRSRWGYRFALDYSSSVAVYQDLTGQRSAVRDLGTYAYMNFLAVSPSVFLSIGARDEDPDINFRAGLGLGAGFASVRGVAYYTRDAAGTDNRACHDAGVSLARGEIGKSDLRNTCELQTFKLYGLGLSSHVFLDARVRFLFCGLSIGGLTLRSTGNSYTPLGVSVKVAYIQDL